MCEDTGIRLLYFLSGCGGGGRAGHAAPFSMSPLLFLLHCLGIGSLVVVAVEFFLRFLFIFM